MSITTLFLLASIQYELPIGLLDSLCYVESHHDVAAIHHHDGNGDSIGICQIKLSSAKLVGFKGAEKDLFNPKINIKYAAAYLQHQRQRYSGDLEKSVIAYNFGSAKQLTTSNYQRKVFNKWREYGRCK